MARIWQRICLTSNVILFMIDALEVSMHVLSSLAGSHFIEAQPAQAARGAGALDPQTQGVSLMRLLKTWYQSSPKTTARTRKGE
ncbi:hypothetical protein PSN_5706 [Pseudomonas sp. NGC7]